MQGHIPRRLRVWAAWRNAVSQLFDRQSERLSMTLVPQFKSVEDLWDYIRRYIPYTGDPALPWLEGSTRGWLDHTIHPLRLLLHAENNRAYVESGYQYFWPEHVSADCDDVALLAAYLAEYANLGQAQVLLLFGQPVSATHAICIIRRGDGRLTSVDTSGVHHHASARDLKAFMESQLNARYVIAAMPQPFGLQFSLEVDA